MTERSDLRCCFSREACVAPFVRAIGWSKFPRAVRKGLTPHYHAEAYEIHYLTRGRMDVVVNSTVQQLRAGDVLVTRPREIHAGVGDIQQQSEFYWIRLAVEGASPIVAEVLPILADRRMFSVGHSVGQTFEAILNEHIEPRGRSAAAVGALVDYLLVELDRATGPDTSKFSELTLRCLELLKEDLGHPQGLTGVAKRLGVPPSLLTRQFREEVGESPAKFYLHARLDAAGKMLAEGMSTRRIANILGYSSPQNFATTFRREMGMTPTEYRAYLERHGDEPILPQDAPAND